MQIGLVGAGSDARLRAGCYERLPEVSVAGVADERDSDVDWTNATVYPDLQTMLADDGLDAVDVRDPSRSRPAVVERSLDSGVGVVCPAPPADSLADAESIRDLARRTDPPVFVDALHRRARENADAKSLVDDGEIGTPTTVRTTRRLPRRPPGESEPTTERDRLLTRGLYPDVARTRWLFGEIERAFTRQRSGTGSSGPLCHAVVVARFESGAVGHFELSAGDHHEQVSVRTEYSGTEGRIAYDSEASRSLAVRSREPADAGVSADFERPRPSTDLHDRHAEHLVACLRDEADPAGSPSDSVETLRTVRAAVESARRGEPVDVAEVSA